MKHRLVRISIVTLAICLQVLTFRGQNPVLAKTLMLNTDLDSILSQVKQREKSLRTFVARFRQIRQSAMFTEPLISDGSLYYDHTGKILMTIAEPEPLVLLIEDNRLIMGNPVTGRFNERNIPGRQSIAERYLGIGQSVDALKSTYDIQLISSNDATAYGLTLTPKAKNRNLPFVSIDVRIDRERLLPDYIRLNEAGGDHTTITLEFQSINTPLSEGIFSVEVPQGETNR